VAGIDAGKAGQLLQLGFDPTVGVVVTLLYSHHRSRNLRLVCAGRRLRLRRRRDQDRAGAR